MGGDLLAGQLPITRRRRHAVISRRHYRALRLAKCRTAPKSKTPSESVSDDETIKDPALGCNGTTRSQSSRRFD